MQDILQKLFDAADNHAGDTGEADHAVGDLQGLLRSAWTLMTLAQQREFLKGDAVENLVTAGGYDFEVEDLVKALDASQG